MQVVRICNRLSKESKKKRQQPNGDLLLLNDEVSEIIFYGTNFLLLRKAHICGLRIRMLCTAILGLETQTKESLVLR